jgi:hypothetical protein
MDYSWKNLNNIYQHVLKLGMLSPPEDVIASWLVFKNKRNIANFLELGSYLGGGVAIFNEVLAVTGHSNVKFLGVDHLDFIGAKEQGRAGAWYTDHFNRCLTPEEILELESLNSASEAALWISKRGERLTGKAVQLECVLEETAIPVQVFDIIHHDYGDSVEENLATIKHCLPMLADDGLYIVDDWCTGAPLRTYATMLACQEQQLWPVLWGKNKVFFAKTQLYAQEIIKRIYFQDPTTNKRLFKLMPGSGYFGTDYKTIRMHWQAMQWN